MSPIDDSTHLQRSTEQVHTVVDGGVVIMTLADGNYFELNSVGSRIWAELEHPVSIDDLVNRLLADYDVHEDVCRAEVVGWLTKMNDLGLVAATD